MNQPEMHLTPDDGLGLLLVSGADARPYLQGQLSADLLSLGDNEVRLAACCSPQGRIQALPWIVARGDTLALIVPQALLQTTLLRLRKYLLRAKAQVQAAADTLVVQLLDSSAVPAEAAQLAYGEHRLLGEDSYLRLPGMNTLLHIGSPVRDGVLENWLPAWISAGLPQVHPTTHEAFIAQMLNVDLLGGISFEKGCYTGQEIIARAHFRGTIKRRMFRFRADCSPPLPGARIVTDGQHAGDVVTATATETGCELLAVISLAQLDKPLQIDGVENGYLEQLSLPYEVPQ